MLGSVVLDVAIGMAFVYLLLSLVASVVQEMLSTFMQLRAANLAQALRSLFSGDSFGQGKDLVERIYDHGLVRGLYRDPARDLGSSAVVKAALAAKQDADAALEAAKRAQAADDTNKDKKKDLASKKKQAKRADRNYKASLGKRFLDPVRIWLRRVLRVPSGQPISSVSNQLLLPAYIPSATFSQTLIDIVNTDKGQGAEAMEAITKRLRDICVENPNNKACEALLALSLRAEGKVEKFQHDIENWYNAAMDRASGWYKKYTQGILLAIGLVLAILFNVDTIRVARSLWTDRDVRQGMVDAASQYVKNHPNVTTADGQKAQSETSFNETALRQNLQQTAQEFQEVADSSLLPVGWKRGTWTVRRNNLIQHTRQSIWNGLKRSVDVDTWQLLLGWILTAAAISLGAPFWFDTLNKFMVVRGTVKPAEKSAPEGTKDRAPAPSVGAAGGAAVGGTDAR